MGRGSAIGLTRDRPGRYDWVNRVRRRFAGLVLGADGRPVQQVRVALHTDSLEVAQSKAPQIEAARLAEWEALAAGNGPAAREHSPAARKLAEMRGFSYIPADRLARGADVIDIVKRVPSLQGARGLESDAVVDATLGLVPEVQPDLREVLDEYFDLTTSRLANKSAVQVKRWRARRLRAVENFCQATQTPHPDGTHPVPAIDTINHAMARTFRAWCADRVAQGQAIDTQNKDIGALSDILSTWSDLNDRDLVNRFRGMRLEGRDVGTRATYDRAYLRDTLIPGLSDLNAEARDVLPMMVNTGVRPSEILTAPPEAMRLDHAIPHLVIAEGRGRSLKQAHTRRATFP